MPMAIITSAPKRNRYVGTAKMLPASRTPRRLAIVISRIALTPIPTRTEPRPGRAETICSTADDVDPAAVRWWSTRSADAATSGGIRPKFAWETEYDPAPDG